MYGTDHQTKEMSVRNEQTMASTLRQSRKAAQSSRATPSGKQYNAICPSCSHQPLLRVAHPVIIIKYNNQDGIPPLEKSSSTCC